MGKIFIITGASGLVGLTIETILKQQGFEVKRLKRWDINNSLTKKDLGNRKNNFWSNPEILEGAEAVIHLAGANVGSPWTKKHKSDILSSRIDGTRELAECIQACANPPKRLISASAIGYYPDPSSETITEITEKGNGFLSHVCSTWEQATQPLKEIMDVYIIRIGLVLSNRSKLLQACYYQYIISGMVGSTGSGNNVWSWIHVQDLAKIFIESSQGLIPSGIYNGVSPNVSLQKEVGLAVEQYPLNLAGGSTMLQGLQLLGNFLNGVWRSLRWLSGGKSLHIRPVIPGFIMRIAWGDRSVLALTNQRVSSKKLTDAGFKFQYATIHQAIQHLSNNPSV
jgi:uncharacterized protein (TIGR01777 family)